jgi:hypothetical protein
MFSLDHEAFAQELDASLEECGHESLAEFSLLTFSDDPAQAVDQIVLRFLINGKCLSQPPQCNYSLCVYVLASECESNVLITVADDNSQAYVQLASLYQVDAACLVSYQHRRTGPAIIRDILESVIAHANNLLASCEFKVRPHTIARQQLQLDLPR